MRVIVFEPGKESQVQDIGEDLKSMQKIVGGYTEAVPLPNSALCVICNKDGRLLNLPPNVAGFVGTIFIVRSEGAEMVGLTDEDLATLAIDFPPKKLSKAEIREVSSKWTKVKLTPKPTK